MMPSAYAHDDASYGGGMRTVPPERWRHGASLYRGDEFGGAHTGGPVIASSRGGYGPPPLPPLAVLPLSTPNYASLQEPAPIHFQGPPPQRFHLPPLPPPPALQVPSLPAWFQPSGSTPTQGRPFLSSQAFHHGPGTLKEEGPSTGMWLQVQENVQTDAQFLYPVHVKQEPGLVKEEVKLEPEPDYLYEEDNLSWNGDGEEEELCSHICDSMIVHGHCRCSNHSLSAEIAQPRPPPLDLKSLENLDARVEPEVIDLSSGDSTPISTTPSCSPLRSASEQLQVLLTMSQARDELLAAQRRAVVKIEPPDCTPLSLPAPETCEPHVGLAIVPVSTVHTAKAAAVGKDLPLALSRRGWDEDLVSPTSTGQLAPASKSSQPRSSSRKRKRDSRPEAAASSTSQLDLLISSGKVDSAIRLPKLELDGVAVEDPHREKVLAVRDSFDRLRVAIQRECQEHAVVLRRPDLKAASVLRQKGLWLNFSEVVGAVEGVRVGDAFPFRITLCVLGLHRHIRAGIGYVPEKSSIYKQSFATSVVIGKDKVYKDDIDNGETVVYTGHGGLVNSKVQRLQGATATDQKLWRGNLALSNSKNLGIPIRVMRGHSCISSPSGVVYTYDGLYSITDCNYEDGLDGRKVYKFILQRRKDQAALVPFDGNAKPLQAVTSEMQDSFLLSN